MTQKKGYVEAIGLVTVTLLLIAGACSKKAASPPSLSYSNDLNELRDRFNKDKGSVRLLLILSPT